jgi:hypothetical protein
LVTLAMKDWISPSSPGRRTTVADWSAEAGTEPMAWAPAGVLGAAVTALVDGNPTAAWAAGVADADASPTTDSNTEHAAATTARRRVIATPFLPVS